jgi:phosphohistidine swiveling domain-containing protein
MKFKSKANTLKDIKLKNGIIPNLLIFNCLEYQKNKKKIIDKIKKKFNHKIAIRSSFLDEDTSNSSNAGKYKSFLNIDMEDEENIINKINEVLKSKNKIHKKDIFFVQSMVKNIKISGVILTRNLIDYSACININYNIGSNSTAVTSGSKDTKSLIYYENKNFKIDKRFKKIREITKEIIKKTSQNDLDIEFAIDDKNRTYILQIRNLIIPKNKRKINPDRLNEFDKLSKKIDKLKKQHIGLHGKTTFFGNMPDWNPAEIIGSKPKPLALSLYQELITNHVWSENRLKYGYRDLSQFHLMTSFFGTPYIDVRIDFNSWLPKKLDTKISNKLINYYLKKFQKNVTNQDKVEFKILFTCVSFSTKNRINKELKKILSKNEKKIFYKCLKDLNYEALKQKEKDKKLIEHLVLRQIQIDKSNIYEIDKIYWLVEDCKKYGTLPFAGLARCGFIAIDLLKSLKENKFINDSDYSAFLNSIETVTSKMKNDINKYPKGKFIKKYGHLRPGTYEITNKNYEENFEVYFGKLIKNKAKIKKNNFSILKKLPHSLVYKSKKEMLDFIKDSIIQREYSKFVFSKSIDLIFKNLKIFAKKYKIPFNDLSYLKIDKILDLYFNLSNYNTIENIKSHIKENKKEFNLNKNIALPDVITSSKDLFIQHRTTSELNFISNKTINAKILIYKDGQVLKNYNGVICIENADPGFDFLFNKNIKGLITKYGGLNSHMSIRCAELNLPAVIGVGENFYNKILNHKNIMLNCNSKKIELI